MLRPPPPGRPPTPPVLAFRAVVTPPSSPREEAIEVEATRLVKKLVRIVVLHPGAARLLERLMDDVLDGGGTR